MTHSLTLMLTEAREASGLEASGLRALAEQPLRREAFVAEIDEKGWELFAQGLRHEYGNVYRPLHPMYSDNDTLDNLRKWGDNVFVGGSPQTVAGELRHRESELGATECLVRFQLPTVRDGAIRKRLSGLPDVMPILKRPRF